MKSFEIAFKKHKMDKRISLLVSKVVKTMNFSASTLVSKNLIIPK